MSWLLSRAKLLSLEDTASHQENAEDQVSTILIYKGSQGLTYCSTYPNATEFTERLRRELDIVIPFSTERLP